MCSLLTGRGIKIIGLPLDAGVLSCSHAQHGLKCAADIGVPLLARDDAASI